MKKCYIKEIRKSRKLTQNEVSIALNIARSSYAQIELGKRKLSFDEAILFCKLTGISLQDLNVSESNIKSINIKYNIEELIKICIKDELYNVYSSIHSMTHMQQSSEEIVRAIDSFCHTAIDDLNKSSPGSRNKYHSPAYEG